MNYATIKNCDIANGPGVRISLFVSGCTHRCKGCFNEVAWDFDYGQPFTQEFVSYLDVLVDGPFILEKKDLMLRFRGSSNQRLIDVKASLQTGTTVLWNDWQGQERGLKV